MGNEAESARWVFLDVLRNVEIGNTWRFIKRKDGFWQHEQCSLNQVGEEGWELVSQQPGHTKGPAECHAPEVFTFKKRITGLMMDALGYEIG